MRGCKGIPGAARLGQAAALVAAVLLAATPALAEDAIDATPLARCDECHTPGGRLREDWMPFINGQPHHYVRRMLAQFRAGTRPGELMYEVLAHYNDEDLDVLAELVSNRPPVVSDQETDLFLAMIGKRIYEARCVACHPDEGRLSEFDSAILAGQPLAYLRRQFAAILEGRRPVLYMMRDNYAGLSEDDFEALAHFFASRAPSRAAASDAGSR